LGGFISKRYTYAYNANIAALVTAITPAGKTNFVTAYLCMNLKKMALVIIVWP
jgi:hypothetical protein